MMKSSIPEAVKKSIGEEAAEALGRWVREILENNAVSRDEYRQILSRFDRLETRFEVLERDVSELREDFKDFRREVNQRFDLVHDRFDRMSERFDRMYERMGSMVKWTVGTLALFGTLITILLAIGQFVK